MLPGVSLMPISVVANANAGGHSGHADAGFFFLCEMFRYVVV